MNKDVTTTIAGGAAGLLLLQTVRWEAMPYGECVKIAVAMVLAIVGYAMYSGKGDTDAHA